jgi:MFS family permease
MASTTLWVPRLADIYGRVGMAKICQVFDTLLFLVIMCTSNVWVMIGAVIGLGAATAMRMSVQYILMVELMPKKNTWLAVSIYSVFDALPYVFAIILFWKFNPNWVPYMSVGLIFQFIGLATIWLIPESPYYLASLNRYDEMMDTFKYIAKINGEMFLLTTDSVTNLLRNDEEEVK